MYFRRQKGYIEQQIEGIALVLARVIGFKDSGDLPAAQVEVGKSFHDLSGFSLATVLALPVEMASTPFRSGSQIDAGKALAAAMLLQEHASIVAERNLAGSSNAALRRALELYCECVLAEESLRTPEYEARIFGVLALLGDDALTESTRRRLKTPF